MGSSAKKKKEKKKDFQKTKLKVGKARPKNTNATDTSFTARSIVVKQQSLSESARDASTLFNHNLSLLSSKNETQRRDALSFLTAFIASHDDSLPQSPSVVLGKAQPLILDGNSAVRGQLLKLFRVLPVGQLGPPDQILLYVRAGLTHLSTEIRLSALDCLDWLLEARGEELVSNAGGWIKLLRTFQNLLSWTFTSTSVATGRTNGNWSAVNPTSSSMGNNKLLVHQLNTLSSLLTAGLKPVAAQSTGATQGKLTFPLWHCQAHALPTRNDPYGYLNLFAGVRDTESDMYESAEERREVLVESSIRDAFMVGLDGAKKEGGEVGRAASGVAKAMKMVDSG